MFIVIIDDDADRAEIRHSTLVDLAVLVALSN